MGFDEVIGAIGEQAARQRAQIIARAEEEAGGLLREAEALRAATFRSVAARAEAAARAEGARIESRARLEARRLVQSARYALVAGALAALEALLAGFVGTAAYGEALERLLDEALEDAEPPVVVRCRAEDRAAVEACGRRRGLAFAVEEAPFATGGVEVASGPDGRLVRRNSFADRMARARPLLLAEAGRGLLSDPPAEAPR